MDDTHSDFENLLRRSIECQAYFAFAEGETNAARALLLRPGHIYASFYHATHLLDLGRREEGLLKLRDIARKAPREILAAASALYFSRRQRTGQGYGYENGWITMLEPVLAARLLPVVPLATLEAEQMASEEMSEAPAIPRRIIQFWDAQTPPDEVAQLVARTKAANPDCTHQLFSDEAAREFLRGALGSDSLALYEACPHVAAKADFFRVAYLLEHGGIYIDADEVSVRPLTNFFNRRNYDLVLRFTEAETSCINNGFIATKPKSPVLERVLNSILGNLENVRKFQAQTNVWVLTGPGIWSFSIIDLALDPLASYHGSPFAQACFIDDQSYNALLHSPVMEYKNDPKGNWRMV